MWTRFMDMHSGGGSKEDHEYIYIEAPESEARVIFYNRFGHNADRVSCTCCGSDYSVTDGADLARLTAFDRGCDFDGKAYVERPSKYHETVTPLDQYLAQDDVLVIRAKDIKDDERVGEVPTQGFVYI